MEPSLGTIIGSRHEVQKGAPGHSLPAAAVAHYREHADQGKACPGASLTHPPQAHIPQTHAGVKVGLAASQVNPGTSWTRGVGC